MIAAPIDKVWELFQDENLQRIMPNVVEHKPIEKKDGVVGSTYEQSYREGRRVETYTVEYTEYENTESKKHLAFSFTIGKAFEVATAFTLIKVDESLTHFIYTGQNKGVNFLGKVMLKMAGDKNNDKVVHDFLDKVEQESMHEATSV
jgi:hypothetical protein